MSNVNDGLLWYEAPGRTEDQLTAGLAAAHRSLASAAVSIEEAYAASWKPEAIEFTRERMSKRDQELYDAWFAALDAANEAAGLGAEHSEGGMLFPADLGVQRNAKMLATIAGGGEVFPEPDHGPFFTVPAQNGVAE
jgi:hypothetical protein